MPHSQGFLSTVLQSYAHHWTLVTSPEDWWFTVIRRLAIAIDANSNKEAVRAFYVLHKGKKNIKVNYIYFI